MNLNLNLPKRNMNSHIKPFSFEFCRSITLTFECELCWFPSSFQLSSLICIIMNLMLTNPKTIKQEPMKAKQNIGPASYT